MNQARIEIEQRLIDIDEEERIAAEEQRIAENMKDYWACQNSGSEGSWEDN